MGKKERGRKKEYKKVNSWDGPVGEERIERKHQKVEEEKNR